jgi:hypothetical protein
MVQGLAGPGKKSLVHAEGQDSGVFYNTVTGKRIINLRFSANTTKLKVMSDIYTMRSW